MLHNIRQPVTKTFVNVHVTLYLLTGTRNKRELDVVLAACATILIHISIE